MATILWIVAALALVAAAVVLVVLFTPLRVCADFDTDASPPVRLDLALFGRRLPLIPATRKKTGPSPSSAEPKPRRRPRTKRRRTAAPIPRLIRAAPRLLVRLFAQVKIEALDADIRFGFDDPVDTGVLYGAVTPVSLLLGNHVTIRPDFDTAVLAGRGHFAARLTPAALLPPLVAFVWTAVVRPRFVPAR